MDSLDRRPSQLLPLHAAHRLAATPGRRVECLSGRLWLTIDHDRRDIVLDAGEGFTPDRPGALLLSALAPSAFRVLDGAPA